MTTRLCTLPNFNECTVRGETGCCEMVRTATACPLSYTACKYKGNEFREEALYLQEVGYRFGCCPIDFSCLPRPSCVGYAEIYPSVLTVTHEVVSVSMFVTVVVVMVKEGTTQTVVLTETVTVGGQTSTDTSNSKPLTTDPTTTYYSYPSTKTISLQLTGSSASSLITSVLTLKTLYPTYLPKLNLGVPRPDNQRNAGSRDNGLTKGALAATVVVSSNSLH
ncbi:hypothetical protein BDZ91DRAFT_760761 [Kalaharituber pfeilii]|nr:hypothetical protein BDZ91DRAFT_760761 [Kalaharituber pfeilii]